MVISGLMAIVRESTASFYDVFGADLRWQCGNPGAFRTALIWDKRTTSIMHSTIRVTLTDISVGIGALGQEEALTCGSVLHVKASALDCPIGQGRFDGAVQVVKLSEGWVMRQRVNKALAAPCHKEGFLAVPLTKTPRQNLRILTVSPKS